MAKYLTASFNPSMLPSNADLSLIRFKPVPTSAIPADCVSGIEHSDTARIIGRLVGADFEDMRLNVKLTPNDTLFVAQYNGPLPHKGANKLPEGASISFFEATLLSEALAS